MAVPAERIAEAVAENGPQLRLIIGGAAGAAGTGAAIGAATTFSPVIIGVIIVALIVILVGMLLRIPVVRGWANDIGEWLKNQFGHMIQPVIRIGDSLNHTLEQALYSTPWAIGELGDYLAWLSNHKLPTMINNLRAEEDAKILSLIPWVVAGWQQLWQGMSAVEQRVMGALATVRDQLFAYSLEIFKWTIAQLDSLRRVEIPEAIRPVATQVAGILTVTIPSIIRWTQGLHNEQAGLIQGVSRATDAVAQRATQIERCIPKCDSLASTALREAGDETLDLLSEFGALVFAGIAIPGVAQALNAIRKQGDNLAVSAQKLLGE